MPDARALTESEYDDARRANQRANGNPRRCLECDGDVWGLPSGYLPHSPTCRIGQRQEREALQHERAPVPIRWPERTSALSDILREN